MIDWMGSFLDAQALFLILVLLLAVRTLGRVLASSNPVESWHFIASRDKDGRQWGDPKKLAAMVFIFASTLFVGYTFWAHPVDNLYIVGLFFGWAIAMLGIDVFSAWARSFVDRRFGQASEPPKPAATEERKS